jgi:hypothetical protein
MHAIMPGTQISQSHRNGRYGNSNRDITINKKPMFAYLGFGTG